MALHHSPRIVTNGLVLCLDAGSRKSYGGTGNVWRDLAGSNNGTLVNGVGFNSANAGSLVLDGVDDHISISSFQPSVFTGLTLISFANISSSSSYWVRLFDFGNGPNSSNLLFCRYGSSDNLFFGIYEFYYPVTVGGVIPYDQNAHYVATADGANFKIYINGVLVHASGPIDIIPTTVNRTSNFIGRSNWADPFLNGNIYMSQIYNRALSQAEITQNYNATKGRFKL